MKDESHINKSLKRKSGRRKANYQRKIRITRKIQRIRRAG